MDLLDGLNPMQQEAVQTVEGPLLVHAGPGSGKTRVIVHRIAYMVLQAKIKPRYILAVTFSRKAAEEMRKRLDEIFNATPAELTVSTIHSACLRILRSEGIPGLGTTFEVCDDEHQNKLVRQCMEEAGLSFEENNLRRIKGIISYAKINMVDPDAAVPGPGGRFDDASVTVYRSYQAALKKQRSLDYDDMLVYAHRLFKEDEAALERYQEIYRYILVDEFQDTSSLQYQIIRMLGARYRNVCVVGDPDQTIYSWRQAEMRNTDNFRQDFPGTRVIGMDENYRSSKTIVDAANALISRNSLRREKKLTTSRQAGNPITVVRLTDEDNEARFIAGQVKKLADERGLKYTDFAVLYRINAQSRALEDVFNTEKIPYKLVTGTPFYKRREVMDIAAWLRVMRNPADDAALTRVIKLAARGIGPQSLAELQSQAEKAGIHLHQVLQQAAAGTLPSLPVRTQRAAAHFHTLLQELHAESKHISLVTLMNRIIERTAYQDYLKGEENPEERWENVLELISLAEAYEHLNPAVALSSLLGKISQAAEAADMLKEAEAVTFNTLHGSKGSEFPVVLIAGVEEGLLPHSRSTDAAEKLEEERRLCYVGITRAMDLVYLTHVEKRLAFGQASYRTPSRFIRELPSNLVSRQDYNGQIVRDDSPGYSAALPEAQPRIDMSFNRGDKVRHPKFGAGRILEVLKQAADFHVIVVFDDYGTKKLLYSLASLEKLS